MIRYILTKEEVVSECDFRDFSSDVISASDCSRVDILSLCCEPVNLRPAISSLYKYKYNNN